MENLHIGNIAIATVIFEVLKSTIAGKNSDEVFKEIISKPILSERVIRTAKEIKNLDGQFWR